MPDEPRSQIQSMFADIAAHYDLFNSVVSLGLDSLWRKKLAGCIADGSRVLDLCCGSGELAFEIAKTTRRSFIVGADFCPEMLDVACLKSKKRPPGNKVEFAEARAQELPFIAGSFDYVVCSFALRNLRLHMEEVISEILRVLRDGKTAFILDMGRPKNNLVKPFYYLYLKYAVPFLGFLVCKRTAPFAYLRNSISTFYSVSEMKDEFIRAGFRKCAYIPFLFGMAGIYAATK